eukprot:scaffold100604_cov42-Phaeocystis_antarctica.AAC.1
MPRYSLPRGLAAGSAWVAAAGPRRGGAREALHPTALGVCAARAQRRAPDAAHAAVKRRRRRLVRDTLLATL